MVGIASKWLVVDWPETASFLNEEERALLVARLAADAGEAKMNRLDRPAVKRAFGDWKIYTGILMYFGVGENFGVKLFVLKFMLTCHLVNTGYATSVRAHPILVRDVTT